jgi:hypothetical protein
VILDLRAWRGVAIASLLAGIVAAVIFVSADQSGAAMPSPVAEL